MKINVAVASAIGMGVTLLAPFAAFADTAPLVASCSGSASSTGITWTASSTGGITPIAYLWGNGSTATTQTVSYAPGNYSITLQVTDASSTVATTTCSATVASSTSSGTGSLYAQIQALLAQINALKQQLAQLVGSAGGNSGNASSTPSVGGQGSCPTLNRNLGIGSRGDDVKQLQQYLGENDPEDFSTANATGVFGPLTARAMMHFQELNGIASSTTGFVGPMTRGFFGKHCGEIEGKGHLKGTANSWMDASSTASSTSFTIRQNRGKGNSDNRGGNDN